MIKWGSWDEEIILDYPGNPDSLDVITTVLIREGKQVKVRKDMRMEAEAGVMHFKVKGRAMSWRMQATSGMRNGKETDYSEPLEGAQTWWHLILAP